MLSLDFSCGGTRISNLELCTDLRFLNLMLPSSSLYPTIHQAFTPSHTLFLRFLKYSICDQHSLPHPGSCKPLFLLFVLTKTRLSHFPQGLSNGGCSAFFLLIYPRTGIVYSCPMLFWNQCVFFPPSFQNPRSFNFHFIQLSPLYDLIETSWSLSLIHGGIQPCHIPNDFHI